MLVKLYFDRYIFSSFFLYPQRLISVDTTTDQFFYVKYLSSFIEIPLWRIPEYLSLLVWTSFQLLIVSLYCHLIFNEFWYMVVFLASLPERVTIGDGVTDNHFKCYFITGDGLSNTVRSASKPGVCVHGGTWDNQGLPHAPGRVWLGVDLGQPDCYSSMWRSPVQLADCSFTRKPEFWYIRFL